MEAERHRDRPRVAVGHGRGGRQPCARNRKRDIEPEAKRILRPGGFAVLEAEQRPIRAGLDHLESRLPPEAVLWQLIDDAVDVVAPMLQRPDDGKQQRRTARPEARAVMQIVTAACVAKTSQFRAKRGNFGGQLG